MIRHIVVFSVADDARGELDALIEELAALPGQIDVIEALSVGPPINAGGYDCALTVDVLDEDALRAYRDHPAHQPVVEHLRRIASEVVVADISV